MAHRGAHDHGFSVHPLPERNAVLHYDAVFTTAEMCSICEGLMPEEMEDKWLIVFSEEDHRVRFHRSWTGYCVYEMGFVDRAPDEWVPYDVRVNRDPGQYGRTDGSEDIAILDWLIRTQLLEQWAEQPRFDHPLIVWSEFGAASIGPPSQEEGQRMTREPLVRIVFDAAELQAGHPPVLHNGNKRVVYEIAMASDAPVEGELIYAQWAESPLPDKLPEARSFNVIEGFFDYETVDAAAVEWHVNFADAHLFTAYGSSLMAQDELQVAEHPALGSLREALRDLESVTADADYTLTARWDGSALPVTVAGVQRRVAIDTRADAAAGRPAGLYGNAFAAATADQVAAATMPLNPATISNILAIAAPSGGSGAYSRDEIVRIARTAFAGFSATRAETEQLRPGARTLVHTGYWGCGAFGGNRTLMTVLQAFAAELAGVDVVFHASDDVQTAVTAHEWYQRVKADATRVEELLDAVAAAGFEWGVSNGT